MPTDKIKLVKNYTRDTTLIIQELWFKHLQNIITQRFAVGSGGVAPLIGVDYITNGTIEIWENDEAINWIKDHLVKESYTKTGKVLAELKLYEVELASLQELWAKPYFESMADLKNLIRTVDHLMIGDIMVLYLSDDKNPAEAQVRAKAVALRAVDSFFASNDLLIRKTLAHLYPDLAKVVSCIRNTEIDQPPTLSELESRCVNFISTPGQPGEIVSLEKWKQSRPDLDFFEDKIEETDSVKGQIGNKGMASGKVFVLNRIDEIHSVPDNAIIVSPMTTPALVPGLQKAAAIVTDEGGVLCHAAVIARELGIPCVIGTKVAAKIFKNGDVVAVDGDRGLIKKL